MCSLLSVIWHRNFILVFVLGFQPVLFLYYTVLHCYCSVTRFYTCLFHSLLSAMNVYALWFVFLNIKFHCVCFSISIVSCFCVFMSTPVGWTYYFCFFRRPPSVTLGFRSFQGKVFILCLPHLVWVFIGLIACIGLLLVKIAV